MFWEWRGTKDLYRVCRYDDQDTEKRVEVASPILDDNIKRQINHYLDVMLADNVKARVLQSDGTYRKKEQTEPYVNSQERFMKEAAYARKTAAESKPGFLQRLKSIFRK